MRIAIFVLANAISVLHASPYEPSESIGQELMERLAKHDAFENDIKQSDFDDLARSILWPSLVASNVANETETRPDDTSSNNTLGPGEGSLVNFQTGDARDQMPRLFVPESEIQPDKFYRSRIIDRSHRDSNRGPNYGGERRAAYGEQKQRRTNDTSGRRYLPYEYNPRKSDGECDEPSMSSCRKRMVEDDCRCLDTSRRKKCPLKRRGSKRRGDCPPCPPCPKPSTPKLRRPKKKKKPLVSDESRSKSKLRKKSKSRARTKSRKKTKSRTKSKSGVRSKSRVTISSQRQASNGMAKIVPVPIVIRQPVPIPVPMQPMGVFGMSNGAVRIPRAA